MSSSCLECKDPIAACACSAGQTCEQRGRSCNSCAKNVCIDSDSSSKGGGGSSTGATAGGAVGGVLGVAVILVLVYFLWWKPRGLALSQKRYSRHLQHRQSKVAEKRKTQLGAAGARGDAGEGGVSKRTSVHLHVGEPGAEGAVNRRNTDGATGALTSRTSEDDNPFGDQNRSSIGSFNDAGSVHTSEFSFRSSRSTNVIPIAYIPPHSSSLSVADGQRGAYGEMSGPSGPPSRSQAPRASIPTSMASRDSLALAGAEIIELNPLPPVLTPDTPAVPHGATANGAPIRPPRSPGLDLQLPKSSAMSSPSTSPQPQRSSIQRMSGFPFPSTGSGNSSPTFLNAPPPGSRGMSVLGDPRAAPGHLSTYTTRSGTSTMSYILDPPQIITPVNANGIRRVEFMQGQAAVVKIGAGGSPNATEIIASASPASPTSPVSSENPFDDSAAEARRHSRMESNDTVKGSGETASRPTSSATDTSRWTASSLASEGSDAVQFLQGQTVTFTSPNTPAPLSPNSRAANTASIASAFDGPQSARSSEAFDTGTQVRSLTGAFAPSMSRSSTASATSDGSHMSLLEGIPFMAPPVPGAGHPSTSSVSLGLPVNVTATLDGTPASTQAPFAAPSSSFSAAPAAATSAPPAPSAPSPRASLLEDESPHPSEAEDDTSPLPAPFLPFAGQRPTSSAPSASGAPAGRVQSEAFSVRSGFGSGLSQIPFQLGFPSGFDDNDVDGASDRASLLSTRTRDSRFPPSSAAEDDDDSRRDSFASDLGGAVVVEAVRTPVSSPLGKAAVGATSPLAVIPTAPPLPPTPISSASDSTVRPSPPAPASAPAPSAPPAPPAEEEADNPFADPRASVDSFALAAALSANLDAEAEEK
ncbi:hypothetical protein JCM10207_006726 [Rhodosporidiobolus poonsookiae]